MSAPNPPISLSDLIKNVQSSVSMKELLALYEKVLESHNQFSIGVIVPILVSRAAETGDPDAAFNSQITTARQQAESVMLKLKDEMKSAASLYHLAHTEDSSSSLLSTVESTYNLVKEFNTTFTSIFNSFLDHVINVIELDPKNLNDKLDILNKTVEKGIDDDDFILKELKSVQDQLTAYQQSIAWSDVRSQLADNFQKYLEVDVQIIKTSQTIVKRKAANPFISDTIVNAAENLVDQSKIFLKEYSTWINLIYLSQDKQQAVNEVISCFLLILDRLFPNNPD